MNYAQAIARRNELVRRVRAATPAPLCHSPWFTPPPAPAIAAPPPPPETSHYADFLVLRMFVEAILHMVDDTPAPPVVLNEDQFLTDRMTVKRIQVAVAEFYGLRALDLVSDRRTHNLVIPRHVAMYLSKMLTPRSLPEIGRRFNRDHTTVLSAVRNLEKRLPTDAKLAADVAELTRRLGGEE